MLLVDGHDANREQVRAGMAWWYRQYAKEQTPADRQVYELAENEGKAAKRGLWADHNIVERTVEPDPILFNGSLIGWLPRDFYSSCKDTGSSKRSHRFRRLRQQFE